MRSLTNSLRSLLEKNINYEFYYNDLTDLKNMTSFQLDLKKEPFYSIYLISISNFENFKNQQTQDYALKESAKYFQTLYFDQYIEIYHIDSIDFIIKTRQNNIKLLELTPLIFDKKIKVNYITVRVDEQEDCIKKAYIGLELAKNKENSNILALA